MEEWIEDKPVKSGWSEDKVITKPLNEINGTVIDFEWMGAD